VYFSGFTKLKKNVKNRLVPLDFRILNGTNWSKIS
jgi:hypothetical protein